MTVGIEGLGEVVTGGMLARSVEPTAGEGHGEGGACLNCGTALIGDFCHRCGQSGHVHRTMGAFWHDIAHSVLHFDGKIWRTLPLLTWHPGELTRRYIEGERARFVSPMALFLFSVFLMFAAINATGGPFDTAVPEEARVDAEQDFRKEQAEGLKELERLRAERARLVAAKESTIDVDVDIANQQNELKLSKSLYENAIRLIGDQEKNETALKRAADGEEPAGGNQISTFKTGIPSIDHGIEKANANPSLALYKLQSNAYKYSWALIPISVPFLWMLFLHRRRYWKYRAYDHIVFITYSIAFMSLGFVVLTLLKPFGLGDAWVWSAITFLPPIHMYRQLRGAYRLSRWSALWRTSLLLIFAIIAASLFFTLLLAVGGLG